MYQIYNNNINYNTNDDVRYKLCNLTTVKEVQKEGRFYHIPSITPNLESALTALERAPYIKTLGIKSVLVWPFGIIGYELDNFNLISTIENSESFSEKKAQLLTLYDDLKEIHKYTALYNISKDNMMKNEDGLKLINWDDEISSRQYSVDSKINDSIKIFLISISYLYNLDFESFVETYGLEELIYLGEAQKLDCNIMEYLLDIYINNESLFYFDDYLANTKDISKIKYLHLKKALHQK